MESLPGPGSVTWRVNREAALLLGGGRALLMQVAHPKVAAGVAEHSDFRRDPMARLNRTMELSLALTFGGPGEIRGAARQINRAHERVVGEGYRALDPDLLLWVHATLIDSAIVTYRTFVRPLDQGNAATYYEEAKAIGGMLGIPRPHYPGTLAEFESYRDAMLAGDVRPDAVGRRLGALVLRPPVRGLPPFFFGPFAAITAGLLPASLRAAYGLPWGPLARGAFSLAARGMPSILGSLPDRLRVVPPARLAERLTATQY